MAEDIATIKVGNGPESSYKLYPVNDEFLKRADEPEEPIIPDKETYTITSVSWDSLASSSPYTHSATVTADHTIGTNTIVELINNQPILFATYGFAIISVTGQVITIVSIGAPSDSVSLEVMFHG